MSQPLAVIVLAAGFGTRTKLDIAKVLLPLCGRTLLGSVLDTVEELRPERIVVMHVPPPDSRARHIVELGGWNAMLDLIEREVPNAYVFRKEMATRRFQ